jgi:hypothetical protein
MTFRGSHEAYLSRTGYQRGALKLARATGIELYELHQVEGEKPLPNLVMTVGDWMTARAEIRSFKVPDGKGGIRDEIRYRNPHDDPSSSSF